MRIRNRSFFIADNVSGRYRCRLAEEILQRGGLIMKNAEEIPDYVIFDAGKPYDFQKLQAEGHPVIRMTVNEAVSFFDTAMLKDRHEFCVSDGVLRAWLPKESRDTILVIPEGVRRISGSAFHPVYPEQETLYRNAKKMISRIVFPKTLEVIEDNAFHGFRQLRSVRFNQKLREVSGFNGCRMLSEADIPKSIEKVGSHAFEHTGIREFITEGNLKSVGAYAFSGCGQLENVTLSGKEIVCGKAAFRNSGTVHLEIRSEKCTLKSGCFSGCGNLREMDAQSGTVSITSTVFPYSFAYEGIRRFRENRCAETEADMWTDMIRRYGTPFLKNLSIGQFLKVGSFCLDIMERAEKPYETETDPVKREALLRLELLRRQTGLNPAAAKYYKQGKIYYSYLTGGGFIGSIDTISYEPRYEKIAQDMERQYGIHVYHAVESLSPWPSLILLYVERDPEDWQEGRPVSGRVLAYVHNFELDFGEFGTVGFSSYQGALYRTE